MVGPQPSGLSNITQFIYRQPLLSIKPSSSSTDNPQELSLPHRSLFNLIKVTRCLIIYAHCKLIYEVNRIDVSCFIIITLLSLNLKLHQSLPIVATSCVLGPTIRRLHGTQPVYIYAFGIELI